jgi:tRNA 2-thiouridine synthesizing protein E
VRDKFFRLGALPNMRRICRETALSRAEIYDLFGGCLSAWRIAGLPNPGEEAQTYLS